MKIGAQLTSTHQVETEAFEGRDLVFLSGTGVIDYARTMNDLIPESLAIHLAPLTDDTGKELTGAHAS